MTEASPMVTSTEPTKRSRLNSTGSEDRSPPVSYNSESRSPSPSSSPSSPPSKERKRTWRRRKALGTPSDLGPQRTRPPLQVHLQVFVLLASCPSTRSLVLAVFLCFLLTLAFTDIF